MAKTLHFVIRVTVAEFATVASTQAKITWLLDRAPVTKYYKPKVFRPRGKLGALLRRLDQV